MSFQAILGQEDAIGVLFRSLENDRLAHAYIFSGLSGVGKRLTALSLAAALLCGQAPKRGCGHCAACRRVASLSHPDLIHIEVLPEKKEISIEQVREAQRAVSLRPFEGERKCLIVDEAERLNLAAANAFLKTLEEPPSGTFIILVTAQPHALLPTIRSRCQEVRFHPLSDGTIRRLLIERTGTTPERADLLAGISGGSLGTALAQVPDEIVARRDAAIGLLGLLVRAGAGREEDLLAQAEKLSSEDEPEDVVGWIELVLRDVLMASAGEGGRMLNADRAAELKGIAEAAPVTALLELAERLRDARLALRRNGHARLVFDVLLHEAARLMAARREGALA